MMKVLTLTFLQGLPHVETVGSALRAFKQTLDVLQRVPIPLVGLRSKYARKIKDKGRKRFSRLSKQG